MTDTGARPTGPRSLCGEPVAGQPSDMGTPHGEQIPVLALERRLEGWVRLELITPRQASRILAHEFGRDHPAGSGHRLRAS